MKIDFKTTIEEVTNELNAMTDKEFRRELDLQHNNPIHEYRYEDGLKLDTVAMLRES